MKPTLKKILSGAALIAATHLGSFADSVESRLTVTEDKDPVTAVQYKGDGIRTIWKEDNGINTYGIHFDKDGIKLDAIQKGENHRFLAGIHNELGLIDIEKHYIVDANGSRDVFSGTVGLKHNDYEVQFGANEDNNYGVALLHKTPTSAWTLGMNERNGAKTGNFSISGKVSEDYSLNAHVQANKEGVFDVRFRGGAKLRPTKADIFSVANYGLNDQDSLADETIQFFNGVFDLWDPEGNCGGETGDISFDIRHKKDRQTYGRAAINVGDYGPIQDVIAVVGVHKNDNPEEFGIEGKLQASIPVTENLAALARYQVDINEDSGTSHAGFLGLKYDF